MIGDVTNGDGGGGGKRRNVLSTHLLLSSVATASVGGLIVTDMYSPA